MLSLCHLPDPLQSGRCICVSTGLLNSRPDTATGTVDAWLQSPALDNLEELCISSYLMDGPWFLPLPTLPAPIFRFAPSLGVASLTDCSRPDTPLPQAKEART